MPDYKTMYHILFNKITDVISDLQDVQQQVEDIYVENNDLVIEFSKLKKETETND